MHANDINDALAQTETDRYIASPGKLWLTRSGQLTILKLRDEAKAQLGDKFDIKAFHDEILNGGSMPLDLLQERVENWIQHQKLNGATGMSDIEGTAARVAASERGRRASFNGATGKAT